MGLGKFCQNFASFQLDTQFSGMDLEKADAGLEGSLLDVHPFVRRGIERVAAPFTMAHKTRARDSRRRRRQEFSPSAARRIPLRR
jgi:hypothetical protein